MIGNVIAPFEGVWASIFDPTTHTATEEAFIDLLQSGYYTSKIIGYKVILSNSAAYNGGIWIIADLNHDSVNTGQSNCYDLISENCFSQQGFRQYSKEYIGSDLRNWLNGTFYNGFSSNFKNHMINIKYNSAGSWFNDDKVVEPSLAELNLYNGNDAIEGIMYPIFTDNNSRSKKIFGSTSYGKYWTRTAQYFAGNVDCIWTDGSYSYSGYTSSNYVAPILRVQ